MGIININHTMLGGVFEDGDREHGTATDTTFNLNLNGVTNADIRRIGRIGEGWTSIGGGLGFLSNARDNGNDTLNITGLGNACVAIRHMGDQVSELLIHTAEGREIKITIDGIDTIRLDRNGTAPGGITSINLASLVTTHWQEYHDSSGGISLTTACPTAVADGGAHTKNTRTTARG